MLLHLQLRGLPCILSVFISAASPNPLRAVVASLSNPIPYRNPSNSASWSLRSHIIPYHTLPYPAPHGSRAVAVLKRDGVLSEPIQISFRAPGGWQIGVGEGGREQPLPGLTGAIAHNMTPVKALDLALEELRGGSASASWDKRQQRAGAGIALAVRRHDAAPESEAARHGCRGRRNTAIGSRGAITAQVHPTSAGPSTAKHRRRRSGDIAWRMRAAELQAEKAASPESLRGRRRRIQT
ncbi:hypothetical protein B0H14DRAFT_2643218 [Mycena olivaceomarginata]|nr:hypothetical protein B0H14DRAFT_2643218 [Mycena olivaceomarginata]